MLGLESRRKGHVRPAGHSASTTSPALNVSEEDAPAAGNASSASPAGTVSLDEPHQRQCATVVCESGGDFGTFTISYDAPPPRQRLDTRSVSRESTSPSSLEPPARSQSEDTSIAGGALKTQQQQHALHLAGEQERSLRNKQGSPTSTKPGVDSTEKAIGRRRIQPAIPRPIRNGKGLSGLPVARSVGDVSRIFGADSVPATLRGAAQSKSGRRTPPSLQSAWSCWLHRAPRLAC